MKLHNSLLTGLVLVAFWPSDLRQIREVQALNFGGGGGMRAFGAGLGLMGGGGGMGGRRGGFGGFSLSPPGPAFLPEVNSSTTWGDVVWDVLQLLVDYCKTPRLCNATELGLFSEYDSKCSDCHPCACDDSCYGRGDCCLDKVLLETLQDRAVLDTPAVEPSELETVSSCRNTYLTESIQATHHSIITACPQTFTGSSDVVARCSASQPPPPEASPPSSKPSYDDMFKFDYLDFGDYGGGGATTTTTTPNPIEIINSTASFWPLWSRETRRVYGNADCASCHGQTPGYQLVPWNLRVDCDSSVRLQGDAPTADTVIHDALLEPSCELSFLPPAERTASSCLLQRAQYIDSCNVTGRRHDYDAALWKACDVFRGQISVDDVTYKNVFCALCNEDQLDAYGKCKDPKTFPFFLVVNASALGSSSMQATGSDADEESDKEEKEDMCHCPNGHVYDPHQMVCRQLQCGMTRVLQQVDHNNNNNNNSTTTIDHDTNTQQQQKKKNKQQQQYECVPLIVNSTGLLYELSLRLVPLVESKVVYLDDAAAFKQVARNIRTSFVLQGSTRSGWHVTFHHLRVIFEIHGEKEEGGENDEQKNGVVAPDRTNDNRCDAVLLKIGEKADGERRFAAITTVFVKGSLENETEFGKTQEGTKKVSKGVKVVSVRVHIKFAADWPEPADALEKRLNAVTTSLWNISVGGDAGKISFRAEPSYITPHDRKRLPDGPFPEAGMYTPPDLKASSCSLEYAVDIPDRSTDPLLLPTNDKYLTVAEILACPRVAFNISSTLEVGNERSGDGENKLQAEDAVLKLDEKSGSVHHLPSGKEIGFQFAEVSGDESEMLICADQLYEHVDGVKRATPDIVLTDLTALMPVGQTQQSVLTGRVLLACQILSLLLLAAVILVLLCCPELLTLQGKLTLNLSLATLLTLLVLGFGAGRTDELSDGWCVAVGVICHYCLLSAFFWLSAAVYNAYGDARRACGATRTEDGRNNTETGTFTKLTAACILLPVAVIALTMLINHLMRGRQAGCHLQLGYGLGICFLSDTWNILFAAVLPISIITFFCLALCLSGACTRTRMSMERTQSHRPALLGLIIHIPLTLAMSGCALCGLVAVLQRDDAALWFSFAGLSVLMGIVYVFVFIIWDKRALKILKARLSSACSCCCCCGANTGLRDRRFRKDEFAPISNEGRLE